MRGEEWGKIDWSGFYADNAFREKIPKNPYIAKQLKISHVLGKKIRIKMKPLQQLKKPNLFIWCFLWKKGPCYIASLGQNLRIIFFFWNKTSIEYSDFDSKTKLVIWEVDGKAIGRPPWGKYDRLDEVHRRKYVAKNSSSIIVILCLLNKRNCYFSS